MASILKVNTIQDATNSNTALSIDSSGRVLQPTTPVFWAYSNTNNVSTANTAIVFNLTDLNNGNHYSTSTGRFTAPIAGLYCFGMVVDFANRHSGVDYLGYGLKKNTAAQASSGSTSASTFDKALIQARPNAERGPTTSGTNIIDLAANDFVVFYSRSVSETEFHTSSMSFFGYLIG